MRQFVSRHALPLLAVVTALLAVGVVGSLALALVAGLGAVAAGGSVLGATLPFLVAAVALAACEAAAVVGLVWLGARRVRRAARLPTNERVARAVRRVEARSETIAALGVADRLEPDPEERRARLRRRYVAGEIDEREFERRLPELLDDDRTDSRTTERVRVGRDGDVRDRETERAD